MSVHSDPAIKKLLLSYVKKGWVIDSKGKHLKIFTPDGRFHVSMSRSPSCGYAVNNIKKDLERLDARYTQERRTTDSGS